MYRVFINRRPKLNVSRVDTKIPKSPLVRTAQDPKRLYLISGVVEKDGQRNSNGKDI